MVMNAFKSKLIALLSLLIISGLTQTNLYSQSVVIDVKGGLSVPQLEGGGSPQSESYTSRLAPNFGAYINYGLNLKRTFEILKALKIVFEHA
jgi:hypothetical protein